MKSDKDTSKVIDYLAEQSADFDVSDSSWKFLAGYHRDLRDETHRLSPLERGQVETLKQIKKRADFLDLVDYVTNLSAKNETKHIDQGERNLWIGLVFMIVF